VPMLSRFSKRGGPGDFIKPGRNGYLVSVGDEKALADRLADVLNLNEIEW